MDAQQAREKALKRQFDKSQGEYIEVKSKIESAVEAGELSIYVNHKIQDRTIQMLENEGFSIAPEFNQHDGFTTTIIW